MVIGDRLVIQAGTDLDSLIIQWGSVVASGLAQQDGKITPFSVFQIVEKTPEQIAAQQKIVDSTNDHSPPLANYTI